MFRRGALLLGLLWNVNAYAAYNSLSGTSGGIPYFASSSGWASSAALASGGVIIGGGAGAAPYTNANLFWDNSNNRLGIGTGGPSSTLHIIGNSGAAPTLRIATGYTGGSNGFGNVITSIDASLAAGETFSYAIGQAESTNNDGYIGFVYNSSGSNTNYMSIGVYGTDHIVNVTGAGTVGIGTPTPTATLDINGHERVRANSYVSADFSRTSSTALTSITGLTSTLTAGKAYQFDINLFTTSSGSSGGIQADLNGGTATVTTLIGDSQLFDGTAITARTLPAALTTVLCSSASMATATCHIWGTIVVNAGGTFIPRFAQNTSNATASIVKTGSYMLIRQLN
jgi:hypothetical protein